MDKRKLSEQEEQEPKKVLIIYDPKTGEFKKQEVQPNNKDGPTVVQLPREPKIKIHNLEDGGLIRFCPDFLSREKANELYSHTKNNCNWEQSEIKLAGKLVKIPRLQSWMADPNIKTGMYQVQKQLPWSPLVQEVKQTLEGLCNCTFNYVLINYYRNGKDYISWHSDSEANAPGKNIIASLSVGGTRRFLLKHKTKELVPKMEFRLNHGSLIVMEGTTQLHWMHTIPKELKVKQPRINFTFRIQ